MQPETKLEGMVVCGLLLIVAGIVAGDLFLVWNGKTVPADLTSMAGITVGGVIGWLRGVTRPTTSIGPVDVDTVEHVDAPVGDGAAPVPGPSV